MHGETIKYVCTIIAYIPRMYGTQIIQNVLRFLSVIVKNEKRNFQDSHFSWFFMNPISILLKLLLKTSAFSSILNYVMHK